jgi:predicted Zn-dependent peptidase
MKKQHIETHSLDNGLTLVIEPMSDVQSAAFSLMVPAGSNCDPPQQNGSASVLCDLLVRGAGDRDTKELSAALDDLGLQRNEGVGNVHLSLSGATLAENLIPSLRIYGDIVLRPHLPADQFEAAVSGVEQSLLAMEDEPRQKIMRELRRRCYDAPWGIPTDGTLEDLPNLTAESVRKHYDQCFRPNGAILGVAGDVRPDEILGLVRELFGNWKAKNDPKIAAGPRGKSRDHIHHDSTQTHIGIAYESVPYRHKDYYDAWAAVSILSGGMSSRLFTEVREKRGLCYSVSASHTSLKDEARVLCYAGSLTERAQETLDVTIHELVTLAQRGHEIAEDELERCKARAKSSLVMQQESTVSRASSIARDWYHLGRVCTLEEVRDQIEALTVKSISDYVLEHPAGDFTILTIGPQPLEEPRAVS